MLGTLPFITVRQQEYQSAGAVPFRFTTGYKLVNNNLCAVGKVAKLGFPDRQTQWGLKRITVLETKYTKLGERAVPSLKNSPVSDNRNQRRIRAVVIHIMQNTMTVTECTTP